MSTRTGSGVSKNTDSRAAAAEAARQAQEPLDGLKPTFGIAFASPKHDLRTVLAEAEKAVPGAVWIGCTSAGEITERGLTRGGVSLMVAASDEMTVRTASVQGVKANPRAAARKLCAEFEAVAKECAMRGHRGSTTVALVDGLNGAGERLISEILEATSPLQQVVGGAAGDDGAFEATYVGRNGDGAVDAAAVLHAFGKRPWGVGVDHGLRPKSDRMQVTKADGNVVYEIEGRPAFEIYEQHASRRRPAHPRERQHVHDRERARPLLLRRDA